MTLKFELQTLDGLDEHTSKLYVQGEGGVFRLDVEGAVSSKKLAEFRDNNIALNNQLKNFEGIDPKKFKELQDLQRRVDENQLVASGEIDKAIAQRVTAMQTEHQKVIEGLNAENNMLRKSFESTLIDSSIRFKATELGVLPTAIDDVMLRASSVFKVVDGRAVPHDGDKPMYGKDGVNTMSVDEWIDNLSKKAPHLFNKAAGGGAGGSRGGSPGSAKNLTSVGKIAAGLSGR